MGLKAEEALAAAQQYTDDTVIGGGAIKGKNCTIDSIEPISGGQRVTFKWTLDDGTEQTTTMDVMNGVDGQDGKGIKSVAVNEESHLIITYTDDTTYDAGAIEVHSAVDSVNGKTGEVTLTASDVGALPSDTAIPSKTSDLTNDSNFVADANYVHTDNNYDATAKDIVDGVTTALAGKVDKETGKSLIDLATVVDGASYDSTNHLILFKNGTTTLFSLDAAAFVKDGMVDTVTITGGNLVITFNTDAGKQAISIPITDIFDPANYYDKTATDNLLADKVSKSNTAGLLKNDGTVDTNTYATTSQLPDITGKADKVSGATNGNFAGLDANGNLTDSGKKASDFVGTSSIYKSIKVNNTGTLGSTPKYIKIENAYPPSVVNASVYNISAGFGDSEILTLSTRDDGARQTPVLNLITRTNVARLSGLKYDTNGDIYIGISAYTTATVTQIAGATISNFSVSLINTSDLPSTVTDGIIINSVNKADKVTSATAGNFAGLDASGNLVDSGKKASDFGTADEIADIVNIYGAKNLIPYPFWSNNQASPLYGVSYTINADGSIRFSGTSTQVIWFGLCGRINYEYPLSLKAGKYIISCAGLPSEVSSYVGIFEEGNTAPLARATYTDPEGLLELETDKDVFVGFRIPTDFAIDTTIKPMLRMASVKDNTYVPYVPTNAKLDAEKVSYDDAAESVQKNLLKYPYHETTVERNGITWTDLGDGRIKANGTATANSSFIFSLNETKLPAGAYLFTTNTATSGIADSILNDDSGNRIARGNSDLTTTTPPDTNKFVLTRDMLVNGFLRVFSGQTVSNLIFKPMIRKATIKDDTWQPYVPNNKELVSWKANGVLGAKNLLQNTATTQTINNVAFTVNSDDKTVKVTRTAEQTEIATRDLYVVSDEDYKLLAGKTLLMTGCPSGGSNDTYYLECYYNDGTGHWLRDIGDGLTITLPATKPTTIKFLIGIKVASVIPSGGLTFKPMLRLASDTDDTYQPYAMTNRELTDRVIQSVVSVNRDTTTTNSGTIKLYRYGNLRILTGNFNPSVAGTSAANSHIADLPLATDYPTNSIIGVCGRGETDSSATAKIGNLNIGTDGIIKYQGQATGENMFFNITWVVG